MGFQKYHKNFEEMFIYVIGFEEGLKWKQSGKLLSVEKHTYIIFQLGFKIFGKKIVVFNTSF